MNEDEKIRKYYENKLNRVKAMTLIVNQTEDYKEHNCKLDESTYKEFTKESLDLIHSSLGILLKTKNLDKKHFGDDNFEEIFNDEIKALEKEIDDDYNKFPESIKPYLLNEPITYVPKKK